MKKQNIGITLRYIKENMVAGLQTLGIKKKLSQANRWTLEIVRVDRESKGFV
jgi:hypothetical protein